VRLIGHSRCLDPAPPRPGHIPPGSWRRCDPLARMALDAVGSLAEQTPLREDDGLVFVTAYGAVHATTRFVDSIATYGDAGASPTPFTTSVHNGPGGVISRAFGLRGPSTTLAQGGTGCSAALRWARLVLGAGACARVLVVAGEAHTAWSARVVRELLATDAPVVDACGAWLVAAEGDAGRELRPGEHPAAACLHGAAVGAAARRLAAAGPAATVAQRLGGWCPTGLLAALEDADRDALQLRERDGDDAQAWWLAPA